MPVTFAGIPLTPPSAYLSDPPAFWHAHRIDEFVYDQGYRTRFLSHLPTPPIPKQEPPRVGVLQWPTGASSWATCHLIATKAQVNAVRAALVAGGGTLAISDGARTISTTMFLLPPRQIWEKGVAAVDNFLLTLVDDRWWWWNAAAEGGISIGSSWGDFLTSMFAAVGVVPTIDAVAAAYQPAGFQVPTTIRWEVGFKPVPLLIDAACATIGMKVVRNLDSTSRVMTADNAQTLDATNFAVLKNEIFTGGRMLVADVARAVPAQVSTVFWGQDPVEVGVTLAGLALPLYEGATGAAGMVGGVTSDLPAVYAAGPKNAWAAQAATDYYKWAMSRSEYTLRGFWLPLMTPLSDAYEWVYAPDQMVTRVLRAPISDGNVYGDKPPTSRFPATLTSGYDASRGYDWSRSTLAAFPRTPVGYTIAIPGKIGRDSFERSGRQDLISGTKILLYSNPDGDGWEFEFPTTYRDECAGGVLVTQKTVDNGVTWVTVGYPGAPCGPGSGGGSGEANCLACFPTDPVGGDPYVVVDQACVDGVTYVIHARLGIIGNQATGYPAVSQYDFAFTVEGCCDCAGGSGQTGSGGATGSGQTGGLCDTYTIGSSVLVRVGGSTNWVGDGYQLTATWDEGSQSYDWSLVYSATGGKCIWRSLTTWDGSGCITFVSRYVQHCLDLEVCCGGESVYIGTCTHPYPTTICGHWSHTGPNPCLGSPSDFNLTWVGGTTWQGTSSTADGTYTVTLVGADSGGGVVTWTASTVTAATTTATIFSFGTTGCGSLPVLGLQLSGTCNSLDYSLSFAEGSC